MVSKNNSHIYNQKMVRKDFRYSIRKLNVGVASVLVGVTFGLGAMSAQKVAAAEISDNQASTLMPAPTSEQSKRQAIVEITNNQKENPQQTDDMLEENKIQIKAAQAEVNLNQAQGNLDDVAEVKNTVFNGNKTGWNQKYWPQLAVEVQEILYDDGSSIVYRDKNDKVVVMERIGNSGKYRPKKRNTDELLRMIFGFDDSAPIINLSATIKNMGLENDFYEDTENQVGYYSISKASISQMTADKIVATDYLDDFFRVPLRKRLQILDENKQVVNPEEMLAKKLYKVLLFATDMANLTSMKSFNVVLGKMAVNMSKAVVDKTELKNVIANRSIIVNKNQITLDDGTSVILDPADKAMLVDIIIEAEKVLDDQNASQDKVDDAKRNLEAAVEAIKEKAKQKANELNNVEEMPNQNDTKPSGGKGSFVVVIPKDNPTDEKIGKDSNEETPVVTQVPSDYPTYDLPEAAVPEITEIPKDYPTYDLPEAAVPEITEVPKDYPTYDLPEAAVPEITEVPKNYPTYDLPEAAVPEITEVPKDYPTYDLPEAAVPEITEVPKDYPTYDLPAAAVPEITEVPKDYPTYDLPAAAVPEITEVPKDYPTYDLPEAAVPEITEVPKDYPTYDLSEAAVPEITEVPKDYPTYDLPEAAVPEITEVPKEYPTYDLPEAVVPKTTEVPKDNPTHDVPDAFIAEEAALGLTYELPAAEAPQINEIPSEYATDKFSGTNISEVPKNYPVYDLPELKLEELVEVSEKDAVNKVFEETETFETTISAIKEIKKSESFPVTIVMKNKFPQANNQVTTTITNDITLNQVLPQNGETQGQTTIFGVMLVALGSMFGLEMLRYQHKSR